MEDFINDIMNYLLPISLLLIGFIRSSIDGQKPSGLMDLNDVNKKWSFDKTWISRFTPIFSVFVIAYNIIIWGLYSLVSLLDFLKFIVHKAWWLVLWIWNEVIHPTVFLVAKLFWHYIVIFCWKFFKFSLSKQKQEEVYNKDNMRHSFKTMLKVFLLFIFLLILTTLFNFGLVPTFLCALIFFVYVQFNVFESTNYFTNNTSSSVRKLKIIIGSLVVSGLFLGLLMLFKGYSSKVVVRGLGVSLAQISTPIIIISSFIFLISTFFLAPYINSSSDGSFSPINFVKSTLIRLPKYIYSLPFHVVGIAVSSILTIVLLYVLNFGINFTTGLDVNQWKDVAMEMPNHIPEIKEDKNLIKEKEEEIVVEDSIFKLEEQLLNQEISSKQIELEAEKELRNLLVPNEIFSFDEHAYVSELQKFSFIEVVNSDSYKWEIYSTLNDSLIYTYVQRQRPARTDGIPNTYVMSYRWKKAGDYRIEIKPKNGCGSGSPVFKNVVVKDLPISKMAIGNPTGKNYVCEKDTVKFLAPYLNWMESWEWEIPNNYKIISNDNQQEITVVWGSDPGTVRVRAHGIDVSQQISIWTGLLVNVQPRVGMESKEVSKIPDEELSVFNPDRAFYYYTVVEAENAIAKIQDEILDLQTKMIDLTTAHEAKVSTINSEIASLREAIKVIRARIFGTILGLIGFILLLSIAFTNLWTYFINYNYSIYSYEQDGSHYVNDQLSFYKGKNPDQPLLGWFIVIIICLVATYAPTLM